MRGYNLALGILGDEGPFERAAIARDKNLQILEPSVWELFEKGRNAFPHLLPPFIARTEEFRAERGVIFALVGEKTQDLIHIVRVPRRAELGGPLQCHLRAHDGALSGRKKLDESDANPDFLKEKAFRSLGFLSPISVIR